PTLSAPGGQRLPSRIESPGPRSTLAAPRGQRLPSRVEHPGPRATCLIREGSDGPPGAGLWRRGGEGSLAGSGGRRGLGGSLPPGAALADRAHVVLDQSLARRTVDGLEERADLDRSDFAGRLHLAHLLGRPLLLRPQALAQGMQLPEP